MNINIFQHNSNCVLGVTFSLTLEKAMVGDLGKSLWLNNKFNSVQEKIDHRVTTGLSSVLL